MSGITLLEVEDAGDTSLGLAYKSTDYGVPSDGLLGHWSFLDGGDDAIGDPHSGTFEDLSGKGNNATLLAGAMPVRNAIGMRVTDQHGFILQAPFSVSNARFTFLVSATPRVGATVVNDFSTYFGALSNGYDADETNDNPNGPFPVVQFENNDLSAGRWCVYDSGSSELGVQYLKATGATRTIDQPNVFLWSVNGLDSVSYVTGYGATPTIVSPATVGTFFSGTAFTPVFGCWPHAGIRNPDEVVVDMHTACFWNRYIDPEEGQEIVDNLVPTYLDPRDLALAAI